MGQERENGSENSFEVRIWRKEDNPIRRFLLWGKDVEDKIGFLILYGIHNGRQEAAGYVLDEDVIYTNYVIYLGSKEHLPSIPEYTPNKTYRGELYLQGPKNERVKELPSLEDKTIVLPYFSAMTYEECVHRIQKQRQKFSGFQLISNPNELLQLPEKYEDYFAAICGMMSHFSIYSRKKKLSELIDVKLPIDFWQYLLSIGSTELIAGIFLALANKNSSFLLEEADKILKWQPFASKTYWDGMIRCVKLYIACFDEENKSSRIQQIREEVAHMDLVLVHVDGRDISSNEPLDGHFYRRCAMDGLLRKYHTYWVREQNKWKMKEDLTTPHYTPGPFNDGWTLDVMKVKHTIQEAEILRLADVIGEIAYYLDAPRLKYYFQNAYQMKALRYLKRYVRRILDQYAIKDPDLFMIAMKALLSRYQIGDYLSKFDNNYQYNEYIKHYLYFSWNEKAPIAQYDNGWEAYWLKHKERIEFLQNDQLMLLEGRFEFHPDIWDAHIKETLDIALATPIPDIQKACYFILKDAWHQGSLSEVVSKDQILALMHARYTPLAQMFQSILAEYLADQTELEPDFLLLLLKSENDSLFQVAADYLRNHRLQIKPEFYVSMLQLDPCEKIMELWKESVLCLRNQEYISFMKEIVLREMELKDINMEEVKDVLLYLASKTASLDETKKAMLYTYVLEMLFLSELSTSFVFEFLEENLCSLGLVSIRSMNNTLESLSANNMTVRQKRVYAILYMIFYNEIVSPNQVADILEHGTAPMLKIFFSFLQEKKVNIQNQPSTFLILAESTVQMFLPFVREVIEEAQKEKQKELIQLLLDSPLQHVYQLGLDIAEQTYGDAIPKEWLLQMLEHPAKEIKAFISRKVNTVIANMGCGDAELFLYYVQTLLYMPNKLSKEKTRIYNVLPDFVRKYPNYLQQIQQLLYDLGGSNHKKDAEGALVALARIRSEV